MAFEEDDELFAQDPNEYVRTGKTVAAIILHSYNYIWLTKRAVTPFKGYWCLPGGKVEANETSREAIVREVKEETGLNVEVLFATGEYEERGNREDVAYNYFPTCFLVKQVGGEIKKSDAEVETITLFNFSDIPDLAFSHNKMIEDFLMMYYGNYCCPKCNSTRIKCEFNMNGWNYTNAVKGSKKCTCINCGCYFTKEVIVTVP